VWAFASISQEDLIGELNPEFLPTWAKEQMATEMFENVNLIFERSST